MAIQLDPVKKKNHQNQLPAKEYLPPLLVRRAMTPYYSGQKEEILLQLLQATITY
jgi:hypothetical protein